MVDVPGLEPLTGPVRRSSLPAAPAGPRCEPGERRRRPSRAPAWWPSPGSASRLPRAPAASFPGSLVLTDRLVLLQADIASLDVDASVNASYAERVT